LLKQKEEDEDMVEQSDIAFIELLTQKTWGIPSRHPCEERDNIKAD